MKNKSNDVAKRYELAYEKIFNDLPFWKKDVVKNKNTNIEDRVIQEFLSAVADLAESDQPINIQSEHQLAK